MPKHKMTKKGGKVGYRKPPEDRRFPKGRSGNPKGRPRGTKNVSTYYMDELSRKVPITEDGKRKQISKLEANIKQEVTQGAAGDRKMANKVIDRALELEERNRSAKPAASFTDADRQLIQILYQRMITTEKRNAD